MNGAENMAPEPCNLYQQPFEDLDHYVKELFPSTPQKKQSIPLFFRADDVGIPSSNFSRMVGLFTKHEIPLCLATVPSWLTHKRFTALQVRTGKGNSLFCWHQHGWLHKNHEQAGKKHEFGPSRTRDQVKWDLANGKQRLQEILGDEFLPFFTPPWNRCSVETLESLAELGFTGISRSSDAAPPCSDSLPDIHINVDLHTRKESTTPEAAIRLKKEMEQAIHSGRVGIMLHHQRMNQHAFHFLESLLLQLKKQPQFKFVTFQDF